MILKTWQLIRKLYRHRLIKVTQNKRTTLVKFTHMKVLQKNIGARIEIHF